MSDTTAYLDMPLRSLADFRAELAERLEYAGDNGACMIPASRLREWIAILDDAIGRQGP